MRNWKSIALGHRLPSHTTIAMAAEIAISIPPTSNNHRGMLRGVLEYLRLHPEFSVFKRQALPYLPWEEVKSWRGAGLVAFAETRQRLDRLASLSMPVVNVTLHHPFRPSIPTVHSDNHAIGRLAATHLLETGLRQFAFVGHYPWYHNQARCEGFRQMVEQAGFACQAIELTFDRRRRDSLGNRNFNLRSLASQLERLRTPIGIAAAHDEFADAVVQICRDTRRRVPYDVAVIGVNDYRLICETTDPPLSSIAQAAQQIGFEAAELLHRMIHGAPAPSAPILVPPVRIVARRSSDFLAVDDESVLQALQFVRENCHRSIRAEDVARRAAVTRRTLDKRFVDTLGHPLAEELRLARLRRARSLLASTNMKVVLVGLHCGFESTSGFVRAFREETGATPLEYRRRTQQADEGA